MLSTNKSDDEVRISDKRFNIGKNLGS